MAPLPSEAPASDSTVKYLKEYYIPHKIVRPECGRYHPRLDYLPEKNWALGDTAQ